MKKILSIATLAAALFWMPSPAQFLGPPCANPPSCTQYPPIAGDTTPLSSKLIVQVPPFASNNLRSITGTELAAWVGAGCDSACAQALLDSLQARLGDSISVPYLHATDSLRTPRIKIPAYAGQFNIDAQAGDDVWLRIYYDSEAEAAYFYDGDSGIALYLPELQVQNASIGGDPTKKVGFFGTTPKVRCTVTTGTIPNPVTNMASYIVYAQSVQDCLDQSHLNLIGAP